MQEAETQLTNLNNLEKSAGLEISKADDLLTLENVKIQIFGKKGVLTEILKQIGTLPADQKPIMGQKVNELKNKLNSLFEEKKEILKEKTLAAKLLEIDLDLTLPATNFSLGKKHLLNQTIEDISKIFNRLGFSVANGPDIENEFYNFEALNIPANHPARDMHDTFYLKNNHLLRTHTSPVQVRFMEQNPPPIKIIVPGTVYRCDADMSHSPVFHQIEGLYVDENVSFSDLKGTLTFFIHEFFGKEKKVRFRPSYFPFTEPSMEVDVACVICQGTGCATCKNTGWLEILGAGLVNRNVFRSCKIDPDKYTGFAFGMGIERIAILKYGVNDIRLFYENDLRFLEQF
ncbi:MAG: phenylalanine--tRNA ligase subunit alpha [Candidatus Margulisiibacteriota bacterium]|jgi:phenylalanyl-tRNA synthetase alpha chain